jgi:CheY-like chemotaxis protein
MTLPSTTSYAILVVEDDVSIAAGLSDLLGDAGYRVIGPARSISDAFAALADNSIDAALLDIHLGGEQRVFELVEVLAALRNPFAFLSAYSRNLMPPAYRDHPYLSKPYPSADVLLLLTTMLQEGH